MKIQAENKYVQAGAMFVYCLRLRKHSSSTDKWHLEQTLCKQTTRELVAWAQVLMGSPCLFCEMLGFICSFVRVVRWWMDVDLPWCWW